jgi:sugar phosphate permease
MKKLAKVLTGAASSIVGLAVSASNAAAQGGVSIKEPSWVLFRGSSGLTSFGNLLSGALNIGFAVGVILALFYLIWGALTWITSGGKSDKTKEARDKIIGAVVGLILLAATWALLNLVLTVIYGTDKTINGVLQDNLNLQQIK